MVYYHDALLFRVSTWSLVFKSMFAKKASVIDCDGGPAVFWLNLMVIHLIFALSISRVTLTTVPRCHSIRGYCTSERNRHDSHTKPCANQLLKDGKSDKRKHLKHAPPDQSWEATAKRNTSSPKPGQQKAST